MALSVARTFLSRSLDQGRRTGLPGCKDTQFFHVLPSQGPCLHNRGPGYLLFPDSYQGGAAETIAAEGGVLTTARGVFCGKDHAYLLLQPARANAMYENYLVQAGPDGAVHLAPEACQLTVNYNRASTSGSEMQVHLPDVRSAGRKAICAITFQ